jgi:hypothetical protein
MRVEGETDDKHQQRKEQPDGGCEVLPGLRKYQAQPGYNNDKPNEVGLNEIQ